MNVYAIHSHPHPHVCPSIYVYFCLFFIMLLSSPLTLKTLSFWSFSYKTAANKLNAYEGKSIEAIIFFSHFIFIPLLASRFRFIAFAVRLCFIVRIRMFEPWKWAELATNLLQIVVVAVAACVRFAVCMCMLCACVCKYLYQFEFEGLWLSMRKLARAFILHSTIQKWKVSWI